MQKPSFFSRGAINRGFFALSIEGLYPRNPFGNRPLGSHQDYLELHALAQQEEFPEVDLFEEKLGFALSREWLNDLALATQTTIKKSPLNWQHGRVLYSSLRKHISGVRDSSEQFLVFETGTARGFSAVVAAKALADANQTGFVFSLDSLPHEKEVYWNSHSDSLRGKISRRALLDQWPLETKRIVFLQGWSKRTLARIGLERINFAFLDAQHTYKDVIREYDWVSKRQMKGDLIMFDDVTPGVYDGVVKAIEEIESIGIYTIERLEAHSGRGFAIGTRRD